MSLLESIVLAIVEGLTEFLPISSTGHMIIASAVMGIEEDPFTKTFIVAIQLGAILSVIVLYWRRFFPRQGEVGKTFEFYLKLVVAFIPAGIVGLVLHDYIDQLLGKVEIVGFMLILGGIVFLFIDKLLPGSYSTETEISYFKSLKIGLFQTISVILPGISRSAATIIGGLSQKLTRQAAAEFSFFLAVPTMFAATVYKLFKFYRSGYAYGSHEMILLGVGNLVAFIVALLVIKSFVGFLNKHGFRIFGYYRIAAGLIILMLYFLGIELSIV